MTSMGCKQEASTMPPRDPDNAFMYGGIDFEVFSLFTAIDLEEENAGGGVGIGRDQILGFSSLLPSVALGG